MLFLSSVACKATVATISCILSLFYHFHIVPIRKVDFFFLFFCFFIFLFPTISLPVYSVEFFHPFFEVKN